MNSLLGSVLLVGWGWGLPVHPSIPRQCARLGYPSTPGCPGPGGGTAWRLEDPEPVIGLEGALITVTHLTHRLLNQPVDLPVGDSLRVYDAMTGRWMTHNPNICRAI
ncbi:hypothetical protein B0H66DRAFT_548319 [Apodospora peruviana]|uniref:Uncharacterized protein n=1 Tax=Apodospora peruviana TaxID=516989 RepID=A0AAE0MBZ0_9PEZI|nr:hypothetical protein B0H66DRAFT_548319 [Apodospora peruviana]